jgi:hypothetical protein
MLQISYRYFALVSVLPLRGFWRRQEGRKGEKGFWEGLKRGGRGERGGGGGGRGRGWGEREGGGKGGGTVVCGTKAKDEATTTCDMAISR